MLIQSRALTCWGQNMLGILVRRIRSTVVICGHLLVGLGYGTDAMFRNLAAVWTSHCRSLTRRRVRKVAGARLIRRPGAGLAFWLISLWRGAKILVRAQTVSTRPRGPKVLSCFEAFHITE